MHLFIYHDLIMPPDIQLKATKQRYIDRIEHECHQLNANEINAVAEYYRETRGIKINKINEINAVAEYYRETRGIKIFVQTYFKGSVESANDDNNATEVAFYNFKSLQKQLKRNELIGYIHTFDATDEDKPYVECFIIGQDTVIKPITWFIADKYQVQVDRYSNATSTDLASFCDQNLSPQIDLETSAALHLAYLKQLLKEQGEQIYLLTMSIPYLDRDKKLHHFFVPSPQVLAYSQAEAYNKCIKALVMEDNPGSFTYKDQDVSYTTLKYKLEEIISTKQGEHNQGLREEASLLLKELPEFRLRWANAFAEMEKKRALMQTPKGNKTLAYTSKRFERLVILRQAYESDVYVNSLKHRIATVNRHLDEVYCKASLSFLFNDIIKDHNELGRCLGQLCEFLDKNLVFSTMFDAPNIRILLQPPPDYSNCVFLLEPDDRPILHEHMKAFLKSNKDRDNKSSFEILSWSNALDIPEHQKLEFVSGIVVDELKFKESLFRDLIYRESTYWHRYFRDETFIRDFLNAFIDESFLISQLPKLSLGRTQKLKIMFSSEEAFQGFLEKGRSVTAKPVEADSPSKTNNSFWTHPPAKESSSTRIPRLCRTGVV